MAFLLSDAVFTSTLLPNSVEHRFGTRHFINGYKPIILEQFSFLHNKKSAVIIPDQLHTTDIVYISETDNLKSNVHADGIITSRKDIILTVRTADCVPIFYVDEATGLIGISHQGWKGTLGGLAAKMIEMLIHKGARRNTIKVAIGPSICKNHYPLYGDRLHLFTQQFPQWKDQIISGAEKEQFLDLGLLNKLQLNGSGISDNQIDMYIGCTYEMKDLFYSYRRDNTLEYGEMLNCICSH